MVIFYTVFLMMMLKNVIAYIQQNAKLFTSEPMHTYTLHDRSLEASLMKKDLGIQMDQEVRNSSSGSRQWPVATVAKASKIMGIIERSFRKLDRDTLPILFKTLVRPYLEYCNVVWGTI